MKKIIIYKVWILIFLFSCQTKQRQIELIGGKNIYFKEENLKKEWRFSEIFDQVRVVRLETNPECLIGNIDNLKVVNGKFYVLDNMTKSIFVFSDTGRFLWKINSVGRGPQEYDRLINFYIDPQTLILSLYANYPQKLMQYDSIGQFIGEREIGLNAGSFAIEGDYLILNAANQLNIIHEERVAPQILVRSLSTDSLFTNLPAKLRDNTYSHLIFENREGFQRYRDELLFFLPLDNKIYSFSEGKLSVKYSIDFGEYTSPANISLEELRASDKVYGINSYWENDSFCYFQATMKQVFWQFLYDKNQEELYYGYWMDDLGHYVPHIMTADNSCMLGYAKVSELFSNADYWREKKGMPDTPVCKLVDDMGDGDNPVIFLYKFKN